MTFSLRARGLRTRLLLSACFVALPSAAYAQNTTVSTTRTTNLNMDADDTLTVTATGGFQVAANRAVTINGASSGTGVAIVNDGTIEAIPTASNSGGRAISGSTDFPDRTITITNRGMIRAGSDAIQMAESTPGGDAGVITIVNSGSILSTSLDSNGAIGQQAQGIDVAITGVTLNLTNQAGGTISGSQGVLTTAASTIVNAGTITGTGAFSGQGEGLRAHNGASLNLTNEATGTITGVYGVIGTGNTTIVNRGTIAGSNGIGVGTPTREAIRVNLSATSTTNNVTLAAGSTTSAGTGAGASGNAVVFGGSPVAGTVNTLTIETGAIINGAIAGAGNANATDILNLAGTGTQVLTGTTNFELLNVQGGTWGITNTQGPNGATIAAGATLRYDDLDASSGGSVSGAIVNNGTLIHNRTRTVTNSAAISGTGGVQVVNTGSLVLTTSNNYSGDTLISGGRLRTGLLANAFSASSAVTVTGTGILDLNGVDGTGSDTQTGYDQTIANLSGDGSVRLGSLAGATLTTGSGGGNTIFSGVLSQLGGLTKVGSGTMTLSGNNSATGLLSIDGGGIALSGRWNGAATMASGTTLTGAGNVVGLLTVGDATVAPGNNGVGTLRAGGLALSAGSVLDYQLAAPGTGDRIDVAGNLTLDGTLNITDLGGFGEGVYRLINYTGALTDNGLLIGAVPGGANAGLMTLQTSVATQVNLVYGTPAATTIQFWDGADIAGNGVVDGGSGSWTNTLPNWTEANGALNSGWAGAFGVFQGVAGTVTVDDAILFTGAQFITDGYAIAAGTGTLTTNTALTNLRVDPGVTATISAGIGGTGGLIKNDAGTLILSGANNYGGATNVLGGTLAVLGGSAIPATSNVTVAAAGTLDIRADQVIGGLNGAGAVLLSGGSLTTGGLGGADSFSGALSGAGGLTKTGTGTTALGGASNYAGLTRVSAGTLALNGSLTGNVEVASGATLSGTGSAAGVVTIADGATLDVGGAGAGTFTSGGLSLTSGSTLAFGLGAPNVAGASDRIQVNGDLVLDGTLNVTDLGGFGVGVYRLIDYSGALTDNGLAIGVLPSGANAPHINVQTAVAAQVNLVYDNIVPEIQFWDGAGTAANGAIDGGSGSWTSTRTNWTNASGTSNDSWGSRFAVFQGAAGTVTVDGAIGVTGMQFMTNGYTVAAGSGTLNVLEAQTNIRADAGVTATINAGIAGAGGINKLDTGTLILGGANTYAGATTVAGGTLRAGVAGALPTGTAVTVATGATLDIAAAQTVGSLAGAGGVTLSGGGLTTGGANSDTRYAGMISGSGGLTKTGTGVFTLAGANGYTGGTNVAAGTLRLDGGTIGGGALSVAGGATFDINGNAASVGTLSGAGSIVLGSGALSAGGSASSSFTGVISGTGSLTKTGTGTLTLSGANSHSGGTTVSGGVLAAGAANVFGSGVLTVAAPGSVTLNTFAQSVGGLAGDGNINLGSAALTVNGSASTSYGGVLSGTGRLVKLGSGTLTLGGANSYTGPTTVTEGLLLVNGSLAGTVSIGANGRLGGSGKIGALTVSGTAAPGNSIGTLNVAGNLTFAAGSTYQVEVAPNGTSDLIAATGTVTLQGGTVAVLSGGNTNFSPLTTYTILTGSSVTGAFAGVTSDLAFLAPSLVYNAASVQLRLLRNDVSFAAVGETANQRAVAAALAPQSSGAVFDAVIGLSAADARGAFDQLSGEVFAAGTTVAGRDGHDAARELLDRADGPRGQKRTAWLSGNIGKLDAGAGDGFARIETDRRVIEGGIEFTGEHLRFGVAYRYAKLDIALAARGSDADMTTNSGYAYLGYATGDLRAAAGIGLAAHTLSTERRIAIGGLTNNLTSAGDGHSTILFGELAYLPELGEGLRVGPYLGASLSSTQFEAVEEWGGAAALMADHARKTSSLANYGLRGTGELGGVTLSGDIGGRSYLGDPADTRGFAFVDTGAGFEAGAAQFGRTTLTGRLDASVEAGRFRLGLGLRGETAGRTSSYGARASAGFRF